MGQKGQKSGRAAARFPILGCNGHRGDLSPALSFRHNAGRQRRDLLHAVADGADRKAAKAGELGRIEGGGQCDAGIDRGIREAVQVFIGEGVSAMAGQAADTPRIRQPWPQKTRSIGASATQGNCGSKSARTLRAAGAVRRDDADLLRVGGRIPVAADGSYAKTYNDGGSIRGAFYGTDQAETAGTFARYGIVAAFGAKKL